MFDLCPSVFYWSLSLSQGLGMSLYAIRNNKLMQIRHKKQCSHLPLLRVVDWLSWQAASRYADGLNALEVSNVNCNTSFSLRKRSSLSAIKLVNWAVDFLTKGCRE